MNLPYRIIRYVVRSIHHTITPHSDWERRSKNYIRDEFMDKDFYKPGQKIICAYLETLAQQSADPIRVLDIGCGNGRLYHDVQHITNVAYLGVDRSPNVLGVTQEMYPEGLFEQGDAQKLIYPDKSFDVVVAQYVIRHLPHYKDALGHFLRIARKAVLIAETSVNFKEDIIGDYYNKKEKAYFYANEYNFNGMKEFARQHGGFDAELIKVEEKDLNHVILRFTAPES